MARKRSTGPTSRAHDSPLSSNQGVGGGKPVPNVSGCDGAADSLGEHRAHFWKVSKNNNGAPQASAPVSPGREP